LNQGGVTDLNRDKSGWSSFGSDMEVHFQAGLDIASLAPAASGHSGSPTWSKFKAERMLRNDWQAQYDTWPLIFCSGTTDYFNDDHFRCRISNYELGMYGTVCLHALSLFRYTVERFSYWSCR
jgi:hypothetical protein